MPPTPRPLLIASLGNPGAAYAHTLHSAGHTLIAALAEHLKYLPFSRSRALAKALVSCPYPPTTDTVDEARDWTLWKSPSLMNACGRSISTAWKAWREGAHSPTYSSPTEITQLRQDRGCLVLLHDDLDMPLGKLRLKSEGLSAQGHNGVKNVQWALPSTPFVRIGIGIGRPGDGSNKSPEVIAKWVLRKMTREESREIEGKASECVRMLKQLEKLEA